MSSPGRKPLMAGNWKLNLNHLEAVHYVQKLAFTLSDADYGRTDVAVLPPFTDLRSVQTLVDADHLQIQYGGQDISQFDSGAYTGEVSGPMLAKLDCTYALAGHSERREYHNETDELVNLKVKAAYRNKLTPILAVGEKLDVRQDGRAVEHTLSQLDGGLAGITTEQAKTIVIAYEPVWAIGTGEVATPDDAQEMCAAIRGRLAELYDEALAGGVRVLYGGSVKASNVKGLMAMPDVDGGLVGGASLDPEEFARIVRWPDQL